MARSVVVEWGMVAQSLVRSTVQRVPPATLRRVARWFMRGPRRYRIFRMVNGAVRGEGLTKIASGPLAGWLFGGGDTAGYVLGVSELAVQRQMVERLRTGGVFYDVGANYGFFSLLGSKLVGESGTVVAFEPLEENRAVLEHHLQVNGRSNCRVVPLALSNECGTAEFVLDDGGGRAGIKGIERDGQQTRTVEIATLDSLNLPAPDLVKIDVEGAEARVLEGMQRVLRDHRPALVIEIHGSQEMPVRDLLAEAGYETRPLDVEGGMLHLLATPV